MSRDTLTFTAIKCTVPSPAVHGKRERLFVTDLTVVSVAVHMKHYGHAKSPSLMQCTREESERLTQSLRQRLSERMRE